MHSSTNQKAISLPADSAPWVLHLPAAIGAKFGAPERTVVAIIGDGGFQMTIQELGTIMQSERECEDPHSQQPVPRNGTPMAAIVS